MKKLFKISSISYQGLVGTKTVNLDRAKIGKKWAKGWDVSINFKHVGWAPTFKAAIELAETEA